MPAVTIRNIPVKVHRDLKKRAKRNGNSTEAELRLILKEASRPQPARAPSAAAQPEVGFGTKLQEIAHKHGVSFPDFVRDKTPLEPWNFDE
jgi:plasmid stability protein